MLREFDRYPNQLGEKKRYQLSEEPTIHEGAIVIDSKLGDWTEIGVNSRIVESELDDYSYDAGNVSIIYTKIGKFCSIASHVRINPGNHPTQRVTQHHFTYRLRKFRMAEEDQASFFDWRREHACNIDNDVWIGHGATVLPGVNIATGASIGAGAVVTKDVDPYQVVVGVPAKPIKSRFPKETIERLLCSEWWEWDRETLEERLDDLYDINIFLEKYC